MDGAEDGDKDNQNSKEKEEVNLKDEGIVDFGQNSPKETPSLSIKHKLKDAGAKDGDKDNQNSKKEVEVNFKDEGIGDSGQDSQKETRSLGIKHKLEDADNPVTRFAEHLRTLDLSSYYPKKLGIEGAISLSPLSRLQCKPLSYQDLFWRFLKKIIHINPQELEGMTMSIDSETESIESSAQLTMITLFMCSNDFLRKYLVNKMRMCQLPIPFILPVSNEVLLWPMRTTVAWKESNGQAQEGCLATHKLPLISLIQSGSIPKWFGATILNETLNCEGTHLRRFTQQDDDDKDDDDEDYDPEKDLTNGLVEMNWYLPRGAPSDKFSTALTFACLYGSAERCSCQAKFLATVSNLLVVVVTHMSELSEMRIPSISESSDFNVCVLVKSNKQKQVQKDVEAWKENNTTINLKAVCSNSAAKLSKYMSKTINELANSFILQSLEEKALYAENLGFQVDEKSADCSAAKLKVQKIIPSSIKEVSELKKELLPLQYKWEIFAKLEKEQHKLREASSNCSIEDYVSKLENKKIEFSQNKHKKDCSKEFSRFLNDILHSTDLQRQYYLQWLQMRLDGLSAKRLATLRSYYLNLIETGGKLDQLKRVDQELEASSLGLEHFFREMALLYEICPDNCTKHHLKNLPSIIAKLVVDGYPLELIDGDNSFVPTKWIKAVLEELKRRKKCDNKVFVTSILGVQSSGKSTFLNASFGINFAVSSGRCTKGAYLQILEIKGHLRDELNCDYFVCIDTEGLKSSEINQISGTEHDNELGTMAVGCANLALINIGMEDSESMKDVLQIVVFALLRMAAAKNKPKCIIVHQNVGDVMAEQKNLRGKKAFLDRMNEMTKAAAEMEHLGQSFQQFSDVIDYNQEQLNFYAPGLWQGTPPMASVSLGYSELAEKTRDVIMNSIRNSSKETFDSFHEKIEAVWAAVKKENFIFSFQNTKAIRIHDRVSSQYTSCKQDLKYESERWIDGKKSHLDAYSEGELTSKYNKILLELQQFADQVEVRLKNKFDEICEQNPDDLTIINEFKEKFNVDIQVTKAYIQQKMQNQLKQHLDFLKINSKVNEIGNQAENILRKRIKTLQDTYRKSTLPPSECSMNNEFEKLWFEVTSAVVKEYKKEEIDMELMMRICLGDYLRDIRKTHLLRYPTYPTITLEELDLSRFAKFKENIPGFRNNLLKQAKGAVTRIEQMHAENVHTIARNPHNIRESDWYEILNYIDQKFTDQENFIRFSDMFRVRFLQYQASEAVSLLQDSQERYLESRNPLNKLSALKKVYHAMFFSVANAKHSSGIFCKVVEDSIIEAVERRLSIIAREYLKKEYGSTLCHRKQVQVRMLADLKEADDFSKYCDYLSHFKEFVKSWMNEKFTKKLLLNKTGTNRTVLENLIIQEAGEMLNNATREIREIFEGKDLASLSFSEFLTELIDAFKGLPSSNISTSQVNLERLSVLEVPNVQEFYPELLSVLENDSLAAIEERVVNSNTEAKLKISEPNVETSLYEDIMCPDGAQCPFCKVPCDVLGPHTKHESSMHQPKGLGRYRWDGSEKLVSDMCPSSIASGEMFRCSDTKNEWHPYKDYQAIYPNWIIKPTADPVSCKYWKWVFVKYQSQFTERYSAKSADIPSLWHKLAWPEVKEDLENIYGVNI